MAYHSAGPCGNRGAVKHRVICLPAQAAGTERAALSVVDFGCELLDKSVDLIVRADDSFLAEKIGDARTDVLALFRSKKHSGTCADDGTSDKCVEQ